MYNKTAFWKNADSSYSTQNTILNDIFKTTIVCAINNFNSFFILQRLKYNCILFSYIYSIIFNEILPLIKWLLSKFLQVKNDLLNLVSFRIDFPHENVLHFRKRLIIGWCTVKFVFFWGYSCYVRHFCRKMFRLKNAVCFRQNI